MGIKALKNVLKQAKVEIEKLPKLSTGVLSIDIVLAGGFPKKRISELYGWSLTGKTYLMLRLSRIFIDENENHYVVWFDREGALEEHHVTSLGIDLERFVYVPPRECLSVDELSEKLLTLFKGRDENTKEEYLLIVDSIGAYVSTDKQMDSTSADMGNTAKAIKAMLRKVSALLDTTKESLMILANHLYLDPNQMGAIKKSGGKGIDFLRTCGFCLQATNEKDVKSPDSDGYFLYAVAEKTRFLRGKLPSKTVVYLDKRGYGIHPLSGLLYVLAVGGKLIPTNKNIFKSPKFDDQPTFQFPVEGKTIKIKGEGNYDRVLEFMKTYGPSCGIKDDLIKLAEHYVEKYNFHKDVKDAVDYF